MSPAPHGTITPGDATSVGLTPLCPPRCQECHPAAPPEQLPPVARHRCRDPRAALPLPPQPLRRGLGRPAHRPAPQLLPGLAVRHPHRPPPAHPGRRDALSMATRAGTRTGRPWVTRTPENALNKGGANAGAPASEVSDGHPATVPMTHRTGGSRGRPLGCCLCPEQPRIPGYPGSAGRERAGKGSAVFIHPLGSWAAIPASLIALIKS